MAMKADDDGGGDEVSQGFFETLVYTSQVI